MGKGIYTETIDNWEIRVEIRDYNVRFVSGWTTEFKIIGSIKNLTKEESKQENIICVIYRDSGKNIKTLDNHYDLHTLDGNKLKPQIECATKVFNFIEELKTESEERDDSLDFDKLDKEDLKNYD